MDTMHDAIANPSMWQGGGGGWNRYSSAAEYVLGFGQDAAADIADGIIDWGNDNEEQDVIDSLSTERRHGLGTYGSSYERDEFDRPSRQLFKEIIADHVYGGISKGVEAFKKREGIE